MKCNTTRCYFTHVDCIEKVIQLGFQRLEVREIQTRKYTTGENGEGCGGGGGGYQVEVESGEFIKHVERKH